MSRVPVQDLMTEVKFGTSGARGRVVDMTDLVCFGITQGFISHLEHIGDLKKKGEVIAIAGDLRPSTPKILQAVAKSIDYCGYQVEFHGYIPSPAIALYGIKNQLPTIMVTGSHIPADRNGIKYNKVSGEILKADELGIKAQSIQIPDYFDQNGNFTSEYISLLPEASSKASQAYTQHFLDFFPRQFLKDYHLGFYQHSAVGRDLLPQILEKLGARVTRLGFSTEFIPVDTEAIRPEDEKLAKEWTSNQHFDALLSTDGDSDRPLVATAEGEWLRGDLLGILVAHFLQADAVVTPVSCNSGLEKMGVFRSTLRTQIGSPFVIEGMQECELKGFKKIVGYEANGGFLVQTPIHHEGRTLGKLPTRDTMIVFLSILGLARQKNGTIKNLLNLLPPRYTCSGRLKDFPLIQSQQIIQKFMDSESNPKLESVTAEFKDLAGECILANLIDGLRMSFDSGKVIHLRASGNAPEFRCYTEADSQVAAEKLLQQCLEKMTLWKTLA